MSHAQQWASSSEIDDCKSAICNQLNKTLVNATWPALRDSVQHFPRLANGDMNSPDCLWFGLLQLDDDPTGREFDELMDIELNR